MLGAFMCILPMSVIGSGQPAQPSLNARMGTAVTQAVRPQESESGQMTAAQIQTQASAIQALHSPSAIAVAEELGDSVTLYDMAAGKVRELSMREYVLGAVCAEMPPTFHPEAIKAQAVAAHSYILRVKYENLDATPNPELHGADLAVDSGIWWGYADESRMRERYGEDFDEYWLKINGAVDSVFDYLLFYDDKPIVAAYHSCSAGRTEDARNVWGGYAPYLTAVDSEGDRLAPQYQSSEDFPSRRVYGILRAAGAQELPDDPAAVFGGIKRSPSGYVTGIYAGDTEFTGTQIRALFDLRSADFEVRYDPDKDIYTFDVTGYGHGVGLSQYGAEYMAQQGAAFDEILLHYYQQAQLIRLAQESLTTLRSGGILA